MFFFVLFGFLVFLFRYACRLFAFVYRLFITDIITDNRYFLFYFFKKYF
jgi:hypothetical protein